jgi:hypothetical protein
MAPKAMKKGKARSRKTGGPRRTLSLHHGGIFGRDFFERILPGLVAACPRPDGTKPVVCVHLGDGTELDVCGVVAFEERYVVLAAYEGVGPDGVARTSDDVGFDAVPYELVLRCSVRAEQRAVGLGFGEGPKLKEGPASPD